MMMSHTHAKRGERGGKEEEIRWLLACKCEESTKDDYHGALEIE